MDAEAEAEPAKVPEIEADDTEEVVAVKEVIAKERNAHEERKMAIKKDLAAQEKKLQDTKD